MREGPRSRVTDRSPYRTQRFGLGARGAWALLTSGVTLLGLLEAAVLGLIGRAVLPEPLSTALDAVFAVGTLVALAALASPLWSSHRLEAERVRLRLGWLGDVVVPLARVRSVTPHTAPAMQPAQLGTDFVLSRGRGRGVRWR